MEVVSLPLLPLIDAAISSCCSAETGATLPPRLRSLSRSSSGFHPLNPSPPILGLLLPFAAAAAASEPLTRPRRTSPRRCFRPEVEVVLSAGDKGVGEADNLGEEAEKGSVSRKGREGKETEGKREAKRGAGAVERRRGVGRRVEDEVKEEGGRKEEREARVLVVEARRGAERGRGWGMRIRVAGPTATSSMARATSGWREWREWVCGPSDSGSGCAVLTGPRTTASAMKAGSHSASESEVDPSLSSSSSSDEAEERYVSYGFEVDSSGVLAGLTGVVVSAGRGGGESAVSAERSVNSKRRDARREERGGRAGSIVVCEVVVVRVDMVVAFERESAPVVRSGKGGGVARRGIVEVECVVWARLVLSGIWYMV
ncbi:hypothetical protein VC83_08957 [Pseudogymnoascus destructans]|uniref:Uncharacterized protein n=1 Tax=Pseudogymnoascus destructans TaxID=655981 RepID=A0A176ZXL8_9PEZI|nr:uncharacterized protein VC83_08957 [Pseudogymnoascus destructans]OAF54735.1 hypothetical protein VC83_08957 [Pseudogymnoascus destructans]